VSNNSNAADDGSLVSPDRVRVLVQGLLRSAQASGWTDETLGAAAQMKPRRIKAYRIEEKEPSLSAALSLAVVLGPSALNSLLALIGYVARPLDEPDALRPMQIVADGLAHFNVIAQAAADGRFDHTEMDPCRIAADGLIATVLPLSSAGRSV